MQSVTVTDFRGKWFRYVHSVNHRTYLLFAYQVASDSISSAALCLILDSSFGFVDLRWCRYDPVNLCLVTTMHNVSKQDEIIQISSCLPPADVVSYYISKHG